MVDIKIKDGDIVKDSAGRFVRIEDSETLFQRAVICISSKLGSFIYDRNLGSDLSVTDFDTELAKEKAELIINEALAQFENTHARVIEFGDKIKLHITIGDESRTEEVRLNGNV